MIELLSESTATDVAKIALLVFGVGFIAIYPLCWVMEYFVALKAPPTKRAATTVGLAYAISAVGFVALSPASYALLAALAPLPGAIIWFLYTRAHFRKAWLDDDNIPEGVEVANDSWQDGLLYLALAALVGVTLVLFRLVRNGLLG